MSASYNRADRRPCVREARWEIVRAKKGNSIRTVLAAIACLLGLALASGPDTLWVTRVDLSADESGNGIASSGNVLAVAGHVRTGSSSDLMAVRMDQNGDTVWTRRYDAGGDEYAMSACLDAGSNILVAGYGQSGARPAGRLGRRDFSPPWSLPAGEQQVYAIAAKYDAMGEPRWLKTSTGNQAFGIVADSVGNCYLSGGHSVGDTAYDLWLAKLDSFGDTIWIRTYDFAPLEIGRRLALDGSGNVVVCAQVGNFDNFDCLTLKLTPDGDTLWARRYDRSAYDNGWGIAVDEDGNVITAGSTMQDTLSDVVVLKYDSSGTLLWDRVYDFNPDDEAFGAACDSAGDIYVAGFTGSGYAYDCLLVKLAPAGDKVWTAIYGGPGDDGAIDVACDGNGDPVITGYVANPASDSLDLLVAKYNAFTGVAESPQAGRNTASPRGSITAARYVVLSIPCSGRYDVRLCDLSGRTRQQVYRGHLNKGAHRFSLAGQPAGIYFVRVAAWDGTVSSHRLVMIK
jgi:hypothetical protein